MGLTYPSSQTEAVRGSTALRLTATRSAPGTAGGTPHHEPKRSEHPHLYRPPQAEALRAHRGLPPPRAALLRPHPGPRPMDHPSRCPLEPREPEVPPPSPPSPPWPCASPQPPPRQPSPPASRNTRT